MKYPDDIDKKSWDKMVEGLKKNRRYITDQVGEQAASRVLPSNVKIRKDDEDKLKTGYNDMSIANNNKT